MIMGLLSDYFKKESDDLRSMKAQFTEELQLYDTDEIAKFEELTEK